jgi:hypothetical protein
VGAGEVRFLIFYRTSGWRVTRSLPQAE